MSKPLTPPAEDQASENPGASEAPPENLKNAETDPDWNQVCLVCGDTPVVPVTCMCGPCTFGEADTAGGNW